MSTNTEPGKIETFIDDTTITTKIKAKYLADDLVNAMDVKVSCEHGVVSLSGNVSSQAAYDQALDIAKNVSGVKDVKANIQVSSDNNY